MNRFRKLALALSLSLALVSVPAMALAADATYAISGIEYAATATVGSFAGVAFAADDYGTWRATIAHTSLDSSPASITGGSFVLDGRVRDLAGTFDNGGSITQTGGFTGCGKQTYSVAGTLNAGAAAFGAILTHYRIWLWGRCITYAATVKGSVSFHLA
jgi:hypothetical protein